MFSFGLGPAGFNDLALGALGAVDQRRGAAHGGVQVAAGGLRGSRLVWRRVVFSVYDAVHLLEGGGACAVALEGVSAAAGGKEPI